MYDIVKKKFDWLTKLLKDNNLFEVKATSSTDTDIKELRSFLNDELEDHTTDRTTDYVSEKIDNYLLDDEGYVVIKFVRFSKLKYSSSSELSSSYSNDEYLSPQTRAVRYFDSGLMRHPLLFEATRDMFEDSNENK